MAASGPHDLPSLYERDETAWLDAMAGLVAAGRLDQLDAVNLAEYLDSMARRDRREAKRRLRDLLRLRLVWSFLPGRRSLKQRGKIERRRQGLDLLLRDSRTLRVHAADVLGRAYEEAVQLASAETGLAESAFPATCPDSLDRILARPIPGEPA